MTFPNHRNLHFDLFVWTKYITLLFEDLIMMTSVLLLILNVFTLRSVCLQTFVPTKQGCLSNVNFY